MIDDYSGLQKAAILLITLGPEKASAIFQHLKEDEIESFAVSVEKSQQRLLNQSYVKFDVEEMMEIYRELY